MMTCSTYPRILVAVMLAVVGCSSSNDENPKDTGTSDATTETAEPDSAEPDSAVPDSAVPDSAVPDSVVPDSAVPDGGPLSYTPNISDCGGFPANNGPGYCDAEVLTWSYDVATQTLSLSDNRIPLNCCGDHSLSVSKKGHTYVVTQTDAPKDGGQRCKCMCVFDFAVDIENVPSGSIDIEIVREITDDNQPPQTVYTTTLSLPGKGTEIIDATAVMMGCP